ncbi:uncharacterized protein N7515_001286 [Penicillium bovifimosum]|uniref:Aminoglycoside phosphotransferase domain-containing protein n=1 Tax=Penicillium bovifimosum TaxID=126998 RepID=A0A9W9L8J7_9EURO|nr:uncharacterized protein N7515_001286 [Penicillium bovifimosum]KAJ5142499.1 hypothetical protein N7515_001286 [Penicillium bovifimosum]
MNDPVRESIKQVDANTWLVGPLQLCRSNGYSDTSTWYDLDDDVSYTLTNASVPPPPTVPLSEDLPFRLIYDVGDSSAVWSVGNSAFCKVKLRVLGTTSEAATLAFVHGERPGFEIPKVLHQAEHNGRSYLFLSRVRGRTLENAWSTLNEKWRHHYMSAVVNICEFLESRERDMLCGVDGKNVFEPFLVKRGAKEDFSPKNLQQGCELMGMDCSKFVFYHADLAPGNIMVEDVPETGAVGIIDWEVAGFFPRGWIRTKFRVSGGLDLPDSVTDTPVEWRSGVQKLLETRGFEDYSSQYVSWWY